MTNERAIELLHRLQDEQFDGIHGDERREALSMAVRALEGDGDTISRQAAINAFDDAGFCTHGYIVDVLEELPSAQPHWIPVEERLPDTKPDGAIEYFGNGQMHMVDSTFEISEPVMVTRKFLDVVHVDIAFWEVDAADRKYWVDEYGAIIKNVLAWMPLPKPYGGESE